ncbi:pyridoxamine 5'-phosphate oxidase family protein [Xylophilus sp.]|uniref:pyridoxamine 5'-phosphate oxidase family protein n=1 Tax=Xylophilus sp. TaxID=2653893 RepID=UPI0013B87822|nr:pyridoxamine 5'-phosphate oxidase family protein [Xylophilus sp.]KAF1046844.1 MAG: hypothetical protein GAK38_02243 [Xylophilus sp.]
MTATPDTSRDQHDVRGTLWKLIKDTRFGMLTHRHPEGILHAHPLTTQNTDLDEDATLYFFVSRKTHLFGHLQADGNVNVSYANPDADSYVSLSGHARFVEDRAKVEALWSQMAKAWFPGGPADPDLALLAVDIGHAEYWDVKESKMVQLFKLARAAMTGKQPRNLGEHRELELA